MTWTTALVDVRNHLSDKNNDKLRYRKQVIGQQDGTNLVFKTFEMRRVTSLIGAVAPAGVYKNNALVAVTAEDLNSGEFTLAIAPTDADSLRATYYTQWFTDAELIEFLITAAEWIGLADSYESIPESLRPAAKEYVAGLGYQKLVARMSENLAETYQLYDAPDGKRFDPIKAYMDISKVKFELALEFRDDVYKDRKGQALAPLSGTVRGRVKDVPPHR